MSELYDSTSTPIPAGEAYRAAGYPDDLIDWLAAPDPRHEQAFRGWTDRAVQLRLGITGSLAKEFDRAADDEALAGLDSAGDIAYMLGFFLGNWATWTYQRMLVDTANLRFIDWLTSRLPASELPPTNPDAVWLAIDAARSGDLAALHALVDWPLSGAAIVADLGSVSPDHQVSVLTSGLASLDAAAAGDVEIMGKVVAPLAARLATATGVQPAAPDVRDDFLARIRLPDVYVEISAHQQRARLSLLRDQVEALSEVFIVSFADAESADVDLTVAVTTKGRLVIPTTQR